MRTDAREKHYRYRSVQQWLEENGIRASEADRDCSGSEECASEIAKKSFQRILENVPK